MPVQLLSIEISPAGEIPILVGSTVQMMVRFQNNSPSLRLYNLNVFVELPNGLDVLSSEPDITMKTKDSQGGTHSSFINLTDLVGQEAPYQLQLTLQCSTQFQNGEDIPFSYMFQGAMVRCQVDTLPRGSYDVGNQVWTSQLAFSIESTRYAGWVEVPEKVLKGAGTSLATQDYAHAQTAVCHLMNNKVVPTKMQVKMILNDSCRYLGSVFAQGMDQALFSDYQVSSHVRNGETITILDFGELTLSAGSDMQVSFQFAVWDKTSHNQGTYISHGTRMELRMEVDTETENASYYGEFLAMELIIDTYNRNPVTDVGELISLNYTCRIGQYHAVGQVQIDYHIPDGVGFLSGTVPADVSAPTQGIFTWQHPMALKNQVFPVDIMGEVNTVYSRLLGPDNTPKHVAVHDYFYFWTQVSGLVLDQQYMASDSSAAGGIINTAVISKEFLQGYDGYGNAKSYQMLAPGDMAKFRLVYDGSQVQAVQKNISMNDYFPLSANPIDQLQYVFAGRNPESTTLVDPHGVSFYYGDLPGSQYFTVEYLVPIKTLGSPAENYNLLKLKGTDTYGVNYGKREQVLIPITKPGLTLGKTVSGVNVNQLQANEICEISIMLENSLTAATDAYLFTLSDSLPEWFSYVENSIQITGDGSWQSPVVNGENIEILIEQLAPGQAIKVLYRVNISSVLAPGLEINTMAVTSNPYAQSERSSYRYQDMEQSAALTFFSMPLQYDIVAQGTWIRVNSQISYRISVVVPLGTIAYKLRVSMALPEYLQHYTGGCFLNGKLIEPAIAANRLEFDELSSVDARVQPQRLEYVCFSVVADGEKEIGGTESVQTTLFYVSYKTRIESGEMNLTAEKEITIYHPNYSLNLTAQDKLTGISLPEQGGISGQMQILFWLTILNDSFIPAVHGVVEIPLDGGFAFLSTEATGLCSLLYDSIRRMVVISIPRLEPFISALAGFVLLPQGQAVTGQVLQVQASAVGYENDVSRVKIYQGQKSNKFVGEILPGISLLPAAYDKIDHQTSYRASRPGEVIEIENFLKNTGGGMDSFHLQIAPVGIAYSLFIDGVWQIDVLPDILMSEDFNILKKVPPHGTKVIRIVTVIPLDSPMGQRYDFVVTGSSNTPPYPQKTVVNIDPS